MSLASKQSDSVQREPVKAGTHVAYLFQLVDWGTQFNEAYEKEQNKIRFVFEIPSLKRQTQDGEEYTESIGLTLTNSLHERATMFRHLKAWFGLTEAQAKAGFDLRDLVGKPALINIAHEEKGGKTYANITSITSPPEGVPLPPATRGALVYDISMLEGGTWDDVPEWQQKIIRESKEFNQVSDEATEQAVAAFDAEEAVPFPG